MDSTISQAFGGVLRDARLKAGFTQERLALDAGIDRTFVSLLERGRRQPTIETLFRLAKVLQVSPATLVARTAGELG
jgi:transcriptional regulator with XRE-family HTH domain